MKRVLALAIVLLCSEIICAQKSVAPPLGWDLTSKTLLNANHVAPNEWIWKWLASTADPRFKRSISRWNREPIESSILVEFPAPHAAERIAMWFVRTKTKAYYFEEVEKNPHHETTEPLDPTAYDRLFEAMSSWQQAQPLKAEDTPEQGIPGYQGFLSLYNRDGSRQMLLTGEDFVICSDKKCANFKPGRFWETVANIVPRLRMLGRTLHNKSLDASGGGVVRNLIHPAMLE